MMDYPPPRIGLVTAARPPDAYAVGIGRWDRFVGRSGSTAHAPTPRRAKAGARGAGPALCRRRRRAARDRASRGHPVGRWRRPGRRAGPHDGGPPRGHRQFGLGALAPGEPVAEPAPPFVPIWLLHRYQVDAAAKARRRRLRLCASTATARRLLRPGRGAAPCARCAARDADPRPRWRCPRPSLPYLSAGWSGDKRTGKPRSRFCCTAGGPVFDPLAAGEVGAAVTLGELLAPERLNRLRSRTRPIPQSPPMRTKSLDRLLAQVLAFTGPRGLGRGADRAADRDDRASLALARAHSAIRRSRRRLRSYLFGSA